MRVAVVALGKIGLPLAVQIASRGMQVIGADISERVVDMVGEGTPPFPGEAGLEERLQGVVSAGLLAATTDTTAAVAEAEVVVVVVPLITTPQGAPDFGAVDSATEAIAAGIGPGTLVSYETTVPVGTTRDRFGPVLEQRSGLTLGEDLFLVHSPERVFSGRVFADLRKYPKLVGGVDDESTRRGVEFYERALDFDERPDLPRPNGVWAMESVEAAELAKLAETTYRDVNIALANEFAA
ncbi:MAG TPA: nucleotide sugar dehydrogenase, partial [Acidimicrobiia bacterium]|nr:nucleotide sugar dehydrogenase [Acidimicrobiia bacterium]